MIAMQYRFTLPADYDMGIVDRRITERAPLLNGFPSMRLKAYLTSRVPGDAENRYAPLYVWDDAASMNGFLCGPPFAGVSRAFGWPAVRLWSVWSSLIAPDAARASHATQEVAAVPPHADLAALRSAEIRDAEAAMADGTFAAVAAFDPTGWTRLRFRLWAKVGEAGGKGEAYRVGYVSLGQVALGGAGGGVAGAEKHGDQNPP